MDQKGKKQSMKYIKTFAINYMKNIEKLNFNKACLTEQIII